MPIELPNSQQKQGLEVFLNIFAALNERYARQTQYFF
jgi:hypothetical protein